MPLTKVNNGGEATMNITMVCQYINELGKGGMLLVVLVVLVRLVTCVV